MIGIDLFSGAGGMSVGAVECGIDVKYAIELDVNAANTFRRNHLGTKMLNCDIRQVGKHDFDRLQSNVSKIVFGGPPCQGFSTSNQTNRGVGNENNWLFKEYLRIVRIIQPDWIVFENVRGLVETAEGYFLEAVLKGFQEIGFTTSYFILNSADYGVPQKRNRLFIVGSRNGFLIDEPTPVISRHVTVRDAIADLPDLENGNSECEKKYGRAADSKFAKSMRKRLTKCRNHLVTRNAPNIIERYRHIPPGGNWEDIPRSLMKNYTDVSRCHTGIYRRLLADEPSIVIGNFRKNMLIHPWADRGLSVREAARLQSFPDSFEFVGSIGFQQQQVGNAVPPLLARAVFREILKLQGERI
ncbi:cytosine-specific methyltransferase [Undibacterium macrobrachii]|uniref:Cytosine-specific methyltransferase n=2 Tax=Undibacterium macrobrachii TaxID=1119058 RepID=A0ABQ2XDE1_9BURK|nr:cytosine-specific methyltransferase [Undibacterium macrobrachii]